MKRQKTALSKRVKRDYKIINRNFAPYALLLVVFVPIAVCLVWHTHHRGAVGEAICCSIVMFTLFINLFFIFLGRWLDQRKRARLQDSLNKMANGEHLLSGNKTVHKL